MPKPNLLIVGCQKCGTSWLHRSLQKSSHVFGTKVKELSFFNKPQYESRWEEYLDHFVANQEVTYYMESTPHYFQLPTKYHDTAASIKRSLPDVKLIVLFRNPIDRYESAYTHHMLLKRIPYTPEISEVRTDYLLVELGRYGSILMHWQSFFGQIGIFFYDDLSAMPNCLFGSVMDFLNIENDVPQEALRFRTNSKDLRLLRAGLDWPVMPKLSLSTRDELRNIYRDEISILQELTGRDLSHWV